MPLIGDLEEHGTDEEIVTNIDAVLQLEDGNMVQDNTSVADELYMIQDNFDSI